jgi:hypothetical protein
LLLALTRGVPALSCQFMVGMRIHALSQLESRQADFCAKTATKGVARIYAFKT